jgi:hypothetical protein
VILRIFIGVGAVLGGVVAFKFSTITGFAFAIPLIKGLVVGAVVGFALWVVLRVALEIGP